MILRTTRINHTLIKLPTAVTAACFLSFTQFRPVTCAASNLSNRLVPQPPDIIKWVQREGGYVNPSVKVSQLSSYGLGLVASEDIAAGSDLISLPSHVPLRIELDSSDGATLLLSDLARRVPEELWAMKVGLKLLQERAKSGSFWWPYISNLPETYSVPIFFQGEDIKNLQYAPVLFQVNKRCRFLLEFEKEVQQVIESAKPSDDPFLGLKVDASSLGWAMSAVSSRAFRLHGDAISGANHKDIPMMLPLIDMCNHSFSPNAKIVQNQDPDSSVLVKLVSQAQIRKDESLLINYGRLSNDLFLLDYGFVIPSNPYDCIELKYDGAFLEAASIAAGASSPNFSSPAPWQREILCQLKFDGDAPLLKVTLGGPELVEGRLLAAIRTLLSGDKEMVQRHSLEALQNLSVEAPLGVANDVSALRTVIALCAIALEHFPTKIMEDEASLKKGVSGYSELAIQFRLQKKLLIVNIIRDLSMKVKLLLSKEPTTTAQG